jgi:DNA polymerase-3 subunit alpha
MADFVHLRVHSEFSIADGLIKVRGLASAAHGHGMPAVGLTDRANLFGLLKFYQACLAAGIKPLMGADLLYHPDQQDPNGKHNEHREGEPLRVSVLAMNQDGYRNLIALVSGAYTDTEERGVLGASAIFARQSGLLVLSGGMRSEVGQALLKGDFLSAQEIASRWAGHFPGRYYLEVSRLGHAGEENYIDRVVTLAGQLDLPVVATNDVCFIAEDDFEAHETRVCIHDGRTLDDPRRERRYRASQYLKSGAEMAQTFRDLPEALANTVQIARRCNLQIELGKYYLPNYPVPAGATVEEFLERTAVDGLGRRLDAFKEKGALSRNEADYRQRLDYELGVINQMGFPGYFLIVMEFIAWAREQGIPVGPGRGSGAGSLVAYSLGITDLDPLAYDLLFERLLNPERVSMPDFDIDFCMEGRDRVINHVSERYGHNAVSQIITFGTMAAKAVVRDVARVQGKPYGLADKLSKLIPFEVGMTLQKAVTQSSDLAQFIADNDEVGEIMDMAYKLEGIVRGVGRHAGGVVIAPSALTDFVPLYVDDQSGGLVSQFDKDDVESAGLVKFDFLGLKTLTIIDWAVKAVNAERGSDQEPLNISDIPLDDAATFEFLRSTETTGIFQLESRGMKELIRGLKPDNLDDIIALVALFRPGPLQSGADKDYIERKHGRAAISFLHPKMSSVLGNTYGVMLYQEQVMQTAQVLAGFTLGQADLLRRAMGKKKPEEMAKVREQFLDGATERGVDGALSEQIFDLMEKFSGYAFNKSHSATYALVSFQTAWLKTHYPSQFMAATLSVDMQNTDKVVTLVDEVRRMGLPLGPPSVNDSKFRFSAGQGRVVYGLGAVRGVGEGPVAALVDEREARGAFASLSDFCGRVDAKKANRRVLEALIRAGAMDEFADAQEDIDQVRARLMAELVDALQGAEQAARDSALGMSDMFGGIEEAGQVNRPKLVPKLEKRERLEGEKEALGLYFTGHPIEEYLQEIQHFCACNIAHLRSAKRTQTLAGLVVSSRTMRTRRGDSMGFIVVDDRSARIEVSLFSEVYEAEKDKIAKDAVLVVEGEVSPDDYSGVLKMRAERVHTMDQARNRFADGLTIDCASRAIPEEFVTRLRACLVPYRLDHGGSRVNVLYQTENGSGEAARGRIRLGAQWCVNPSDELLRALRAEFGDDRVDLNYVAADA